MLVTSHLLVGAVIGSLFSSWPPVVVIAFFSHFVLDAIPHTESSTFRPIAERSSIKKIDYLIALIDFIFGFLILGLIFFRKGDYFLPFLGAIFAIVPDLDNLSFLYRYFQNLPIFKQLYQVHIFLHFDLKTKYWPIGIVTQLIIIGVVIWWLLPK